MDFETKATVIYCLCDDFLKVFGHKDDKQCRINTAEVITTAFISSMMFSGNISKTRAVLLSLKMTPHLLSISRLNRRFLKIDDILWSSLLKIISEALHKHNQHKEHASFPVPFHLVEVFAVNYIKENHGYCAAKKMFYQDIKVHLLVDMKGVLIEWSFTPASVNDFTALTSFDLDVPENSVIYADKAYNCYRFEDDLYEISNVRLLPARKYNSKRQHHCCISYLLSVKRKIVETTFSVIQGMFPKHINAKSVRGFEVRIFLFILTYALGLIFRPQANFDPDCYPNLD